MATQLSSSSTIRQKRCSEEELENNYKMKKLIKQCSSSSSSSSMINQQHQSWSDLDSDLLREINKKLCCYADHIGFRGVCKSWRAAGRVETPGDVLPWFITLHIEELERILLYKLYEPNFKSSRSTVAASGTINLDDYFNHDALPSLFRYVDGWLHISVYDFQLEASYFLFLSLATKASITIPQFNHSTVPLFLALSTTPDSPDCVFLTLCLTIDDAIMIGIFRHGDTHWTTTTIAEESVKAWFGGSGDMEDVFFGGVFYFLNTSGIGSYDLATGALKFHHFSAVLEFIYIHSFFGLDGDLMLAYIEKETRKLCIRKFDWMKKVWVPLQTLGGRSLYLNGTCVYVDHINYYRISSAAANKIYVRIVNQISYVDEYTLEEDGQLSKCPSPTLVRWAGPGCKESAMWVSPPHVLPRK